jgi:hypothetical protein
MAERGTIDFGCPGCGARISVSERSAGARVRCSFCGRATRIPTDNVFSPAPVPIREFYWTAQQKQWILCAAVVALIALFSFRVAHTRTASTPRFDKSPAKQAARKKLIDGLIRDGAISRAKPGESAELWVGLAFRVAKFEEQENVASMAFCYLCPNDSEYATLSIVEDSTGKEIGQFTPLGLEMY